VGYIWGMTDSPFSAREFRAAAEARHPTGIWGLLVVWIAIAAINIGYAMRLRPPRIAADHDGNPARLDAGPREPGCPVARAS
jgi:hypothetical protein